jgi:hypothetical protein
MAKGQKRNNRETKKPKQVKPAPIVAGSSGDRVKQAVSSSFQRPKGKV